MAKISPLWLILLLGLLLRLINLNQSFWLDEASQAQLSSWSLVQIWSGRGGDFHPPLFYILAHLWLQVGRSEVWLRTLPILFGLLSIALLPRLAAHLYPQTHINFFRWQLSPANLSAFFLAIAPFHIYYSQEFRSYSLLLFLGLASMYFFLKNRSVFLQTLLNLALLYTHYSSVYLIFTQFLLHIFIYRRSWRLLFFQLGLLFLGFLPWLPQFLTQFTSGGNAELFLPGWSRLLTISPFKALPVILFKLIAGRIDFLSRPLYYFYATLVIGFTFLCFILARKLRRLYFPWIFIPTFLLISFSLFIPQAQPFRVIYVLPALLLLFVEAASRFPKLVITIFVYICLVGNITYFTRPRLQREQWRQAIQFLVANQTPTSAVIVKFPDSFASFKWYAPDFPVYPAVTSMPATASNVSSRLSSFVPGKSHLYLLDYLGEITDPDNQVSLTLHNLGFSEIKNNDFPGVGYIREFAPEYD